MNYGDTICGFLREDFEKGYHLFGEYVVPYIEEGADDPVRSFWESWVKGLPVKRQEEELRGLVSIEAELLGITDYHPADSVPELLEQVEDLSRAIAMYMEECVFDGRFKRRHLSEENPEFREIWDDLPDEYKRLDQKSQGVIAGATASVFEAILRTENEKELEECDENLEFTREMMIIAAVIAIVSIVIFASLFFDCWCPAVMAISEFLLDHMFLEGVLVFISYFGSCLGVWAAWELGHDIREEHGHKEKIRARTLEFA
ncbi:MAG: hypothetical protein LUD01_04440 [Clostridiales bacterium]|nr:hypothetical protein [Clostridiales bacterium]